MRERLERLRRQHAEIGRIDFFDAPEGNLVAAHLARIAQALAAGEVSATSVAPATLETYRDRRWVTRPRPHVDRLACIWLIRRFINPAAVIRYATTPEDDEVAFDMRQGTFSHRGTCVRLNPWSPLSGLRSRACTSWEKSSTRSICAMAATSTPRPPSSTPCSRAGS